MLTRRVTYRLYPSTSQLNKLFYWRRLHAYLYNGAVSNRTTQYRKFNHSVDYFEQQASLPGFKQTWVEYLELNAGSLQATLKRVDFAVQRFFQGLAKYPKFKPIKQYSGWTYPDARQGFKVHSKGKNGYLELTDLGCKIQMRGEARTWGSPTTCTLLYRNGKWYASITVKCEPKRENRLHICSNKKCNHTEDRDVNSAQVCLSWARGLERTSSQTADESSSTEIPKVKYCGGFQQLAQTKRQKLMAQRSEAE